MSGYQNLGLNVAGLRSEFFEAYRAKRTIWQDLCTTIKSNKDQENHKWLGSAPLMRPWGTGRLARGIRSESYDVPNMKYESTIEVDRDEVADDQTGQISIRVKELGSNAAQHKDSELAGLINNGHSAGYVSYDGKTFFATDHESGASGAQSNDLTFDISAVLPNEPNTPTAPSPRTMQEAVAQAIAAMSLLKDDVGEPQEIDPAGVIVVTHPSLKYAAQVGLGASVIGNTSNISQGIQRVEAFSRLTSAARFFVFKTDGHIRPFMFQDREPVEFGSLEKDSEPGFMREKYIYGVRARYRLMFAEWRYAMAVTLV